MSGEITIETKVEFTRVRHGRKTLYPPAELPAGVPTTPGRVPRIARLMALALRFERLMDTGNVADFAEIARLGHVTRARVTQIMNLTLLAPDIQDEILHLPEVTEGRDPVKEWQLRPIASTPDWRKQRRKWRELLRIAL
jgi:hypothetical protein